MGLMDSIKEGFSGQSWIDEAGSLGAVSIPDGGKVDLPAGKVKVTYAQDDRTKIYSGESEQPPRLPNMSARLGGKGDPIEFKPTSGGGSKRRAGGKTRIYVGELSVREAGTYTIDCQEPFDDPVKKVGPFETGRTRIEIGTNSKLLFDGPSGAR